MRAAVVSRPGGPAVFEIQELPDPDVAPDEVLVAVRACAICRPDLGMREGRSRAVPGVRNDLPGMEIAGVVERTGDRVTEWHEGDRVMARTLGGGYGSKIAVQESLLMRIPSTLTFEEAASVPDAFFTAFDALFLQCQAQPGESVLIHAVGSGVGIAAVQLAAVAGCRVLGTARSDEKLTRARALGLDVAINPQHQDFADVVAAETNGRGVEVLLDLVGGSYWNANLRSIGVLGRLVVIGTLDGALVETDLRLLMGQRVRLFGTNLVRRRLDERALLTRAFAQQVLPLFERREVVPVIDRVYPLAEVSEAHRQMESNASFGKIVLRHDA